MQKLLVNVRYFEKAAKFETVLPIFGRLIKYIVASKNLRNFVAFSEYLNVRIFQLFFSLPYHFDNWKNKLTVAFVDGNQKIDKIFCRRMICETELGQCKEFGTNGQLKPIDHKSDKFHVIATMGMYILLYWIFIPCYKIIF